MNEIKPLDSVFGSKYWAWFTRPSGYKVYTVFGYNHDTQTFYFSNRKNKQEIISKTIVELASTLNFRPFMIDCVELNKQVDKYMAERI